MRIVKKVSSYILALAILLSCFPGITLKADANTDGYYAANHEIFTYYGRWSEDVNGYMTSGWGTSKLRFKLTGGSSFTVHSTANDYTDRFLYVSTDDTTFQGVLPDADSGDYTFNLGGEGPFEVLLFTPNSVSGKSNATITGITFHDGTPSKTEINRPIVEIIGDSISDDWLTDTNNDTVAASSSYIAKEMGWEAVNVAYAGITLTDRQNNAGCSPSGMETMYFRANNTGSDTTAWNFSTEQEPDYIMLHIGTNDRYFGVNATDFEATYTDFCVT